MNTEIIPFTLQALTDSASRIKAHAAWLSLKQSECRPGDPPVLLTNPDFAADLRNEQAYFAKISMDILEALNNPAVHNLPEGQCASWRRRVLDMEAEVERVTQGKDL